MELLERPRGSELSGAVCPLLQDQAIRPVRGLARCRRNRGRHRARQSARQARVRYVRRKTRGRPGTSPRGWRSKDRRRRRARRRPRGRRPARSHWLPRGRLRRAHGLGGPGRSSGLVGCRAAGAAPVGPAAAPRVGWSRHLQPVLPPGRSRAGSSPGSDRRFGARPHRTNCRRPGRRPRPAGRGADGTRSLRVLARPARGQACCRHRPEPRHPRRLVRRAQLFGAGSGAPSLAIATRRQGGRSGSLAPGRAGWLLPGCRLSLRRRGCWAPERLRSRPPVGPGEVRETPERRLDLQPSVGSRPMGRPNLPGESGPAPQRGPRGPGRGWLRARSVSPPASPMARAPPTRSACGG
jgi:hypothetical protein